MWTSIGIGAVAGLFFLIGWELSASRRRSLAIRGDTIRISESTWGRELAYHAYDITERELVLDQAAVARLIASAMLRRPFKSQNVLSDRWESLARDWPGTWVYESRDSFGRPIYLTDIALGQMFLFYRGFMDFTLQQEIEKQFQAFPLFHAAIKLRDFHEAIGD